MALSVIKNNYVALGGDTVEIDVVSLSIQSRAWNVINCGPRPSNPLKTSPDRQTNSKLPILTTQNCYKALEHLHSSDSCMDWIYTVLKHYFRIVVPFLVVKPARVVFPLSRSPLSRSFPLSRSGVMSPKLFFYKRPFFRNKNNVYMLLFVGDKIIIWHP